MPFPFDDLSATKVRPAVCLTDPIGPFGHTVLAFVTSTVLADPLETDLVLDPSNPAHAVTGLQVASTVRLHRLMTVSASFIRRELGRLPLDLQGEVEKRLRALFGLT